MPALSTMARTSASQLARIHAMWTLEGLAALDAELVRELMKSPDPQIRIQAIRASETLYKDTDKSLRRRLPGDDRRRRPERRHPGDADDEPAEGAGRAKIIAATVAARPSAASRRSAARS